MVGVKGKGGGHCFAQHLMTSLLPNVYRGKETFCIVRDVYTRMISEFGYSTAMKYGMEVTDIHKYKCEASDLNSFVIEQLTTKTAENFYWHDCHFVPQAGFVYAWDLSKKRVNFSEKWCTHVLRFENLTDEMNSMLKWYGYPLRIEKENRAYGTVSKGSCTKLKPSNFSPEALALMQKVYWEDFAMLKALDAERDAEPWRQSIQAVEPLKPLEVGHSRELIGEAVEAFPSMLLREGLTTNPDFELSFDITPLSAGEVNVHSSIFRLTNSTNSWGKIGDRMPACLFIGGGTRLQCFMGRPDSHNANCVMPLPGLPLGQVSFVSMKLTGTDFVVSVNGTQACVVPGYTSKYSAMTDVQLWVGDRFHIAADVLLANMVYTASDATMTSAQALGATFSRRQSVLRSSSGKTA